MDDLHLDILGAMITTARQQDTDIVLSWRVLLALLDEIHGLRTELGKRPTPPELTALRTEVPHEQATTDDT